jgi:hypothetical protein
MVNVKTIFVRFKTRDEKYAGTDGNVYVGIGGREFRIDSDRDDFERGDDRTYILGEDPITLPENPENISGFATDPESPYILKTENLILFPVYVRLESAETWQSAWHLDYVEIRVNPDTDNITYSALDADNEWLFLGGGFGRTLYLIPKPPIIRVGKDSQKQE